MRSTAIGAARSSSSSRGREPVPGSASNPATSPFVFANADMSLEQAQAVWTGLRKGITEIQNGNASQLRYEELYRNAYTLVLHKHGDLLYGGVAQTISEKLEQTAVLVEKANDETLLRIMVREWDNHKLVMTMIRDVLMYMDKTYCDREDKTPVFELGVVQFREQILMRKGLREKLQSVLLRNIERERHAELIERELMKTCLTMLVEVAPQTKQMYEEHFEKEFLAETSNFYQREAQQFISQNTCADYLRKAEIRIQEEEERANAYLHPSTKPKLTDVINTELLVKYAQILVENPTSGCVPMFTHSLIDDLSRMYHLLSRVPNTLGLMRHCMLSLVRDSGQAIVNDQHNRKSPTNYVQSVLDLRSKYSSIVSEAFAADRSFSRSLKDAFEHFINLDSRSAQFLSLYIDELLKKGLRGIPADEIDGRLDNVMTIFRYLSDKDVFEEFYKQHLAARLLVGRRVSDDVERSMIAKLKAECGHQFTSKLEGMFKNMHLSKELNESFQQWQMHKHKQRSSEPPDIYVNVLTSGFWPFPEVSPCDLPAVVLHRAEEFRDFYKSKHSGHRLNWQTNLGSAELVCEFDGGKKELLVHTYQMCILMLYNRSESFSFAELLQLSRVPEPQLQRHLLSLAHPKVKVLLKSPNTKKVAPDHVFRYNRAYTSCLFRVRIPLLALGSGEVGGVGGGGGGGGPEEGSGAGGRGGSGPGSGSRVPSLVLEARKNRVEASIVRIMKARRRLQHAQLVAEVSKQLATRFAAEPAFIKRRIEALIEKEYIERDPTDRKLYHYLA